MNESHTKCLLCEARKRDPVCRTTAGGRSFADVGTRACFRPGETLFSQGDPAGDVFFLSSGAVRLIHEHIDGTQQILRMAGPGEALGVGISEVSLMVASAVAQKPTQTCRARLSDVDAMIQRDPGFALSWVHLLSSEVQRAREIVFLLSAHPAAVRLARFLWRGASPSRNGPPGRPAGLEIEITHADIAASLSIAPETVTRLLGDLEEKGVLRLFRGRIRVLDHDRLAALAGFPDSTRDAAIG